MLSIVVIGRNEAEHLEGLGKSIAALRESCDFPVESIFIDSASTDNSVPIAEQYFDCVELLNESKHLCASAGRYAGTCEAKYPWIFYIDGDMEICSEFFPVVHRLDDIEPECVGVVGLYIHRFDNGRSAFQPFKRLIGTGMQAMHFGGAVLLRREAVLGAGNWDPALYGKEEIELYARLGNGRQVVKFVHVPMIYHYSEYYTRWELAKRMLMPSGGLGKVFWGYGQCVRAAVVKGKFRALARLEFELYAFWFSLCMILMVGFVFSFVWSAILAVMVVTGLSLWSRPGSVVRYLLQPLSLIPGWWKYFPWFRPMLRKWNPEGGQAA